MLYHYWLLRYVPDSARPDTVGVGVAVVGEGPTDVAIRVVTRYADIPDIGGPRKEFAQVLRDIEGDIVRYSQQQEGFAISYTSSARTYLERLRRQNYGILRVDSPMVAAGESAQLLCNLLFDRLVTRAQKEQRAPNRVMKIRKKVEELYNSNAVIAERLVKKPQIQLHKGSSKVDLAILGENYQELTRSFSFAVSPTSELRDRGIAFAHHIDKLRNDGATICNNNEQHRLQADTVAVLAVVEHPETSQQDEIFKEATADWSDLKIEMIDTSQLSYHVNQVESKLVAA